MACCANETNLKISKFAGTNLTLTLTCSQWEREKSFLPLGEDLDEGTFQFQ